MQGLLEYYIQFPLKIDHYSLDKNENMPLSVNLILDKWMERGDDQRSPLLNEI